MTDLLFAHFSHTRPGLLGQTRPICHKTRAVLQNNKSAGLAELASRERRGRGRGQGGIAEAPLAIEVPAADAEQGILRATSAAQDPEGAAQLAATLPMECAAARKETTETLTKEHALKRKRLQEEFYCREGADSQAAQG
ncbi:hypothetical protein WJX84_005910 [Apatococcus fuscideae]|uniref:Uncharacterized protein n=1 Tax=Apatococcus fuscideae TaxID=2026836 RepID=A0AAW1T877_9CHLO